MIRILLSILLLLSTTARADDVQGIFYNAVTGQVSAKTRANGDKLLDQTALAADAIYTCDILSNFASGWSSSSNTYNTNSSTNKYIDTLSSYSGTTWTAKVAGTYRVTATGYITKTSGTFTTGDAIAAAFIKNGSIYGTGQNVDGSGAVATNPYTLTGFIPMAVGDTLIVRLGWNGTGGHTFTGTVTYACLTVSRL
jgi:hypothetical protein